MGGNFSALKELKEYYPNGKIRKHEFYQDGHLEGERKEWHKNGQLYIQELYQDGKLNGEQKEWYENGYLSRERSYRMGGSIIEARYFYDGNWSLLHARKETKIWDPSGYLWSHNIRRPNDVHESKIWYSNGQLRDREFYRDKLNLLSIETWHENGYPKSRTFFQDGKKEGEWRHWMLDSIGNIRKFSRGGKVIDDHFTIRKKMILLALKRKLFRLKHRNFPLNEIIISDLINFTLNM